MTIWSLPCFRISGSDTPSLSIRLRMIETERSRSSEVSLWPFGGEDLVAEFERGYLALLLTHLALPRSYQEETDDGEHDEDEEICEQRHASGADASRASASAL